MVLWYYRQYYISHMEMWKSFLWKVVLTHNLNSKKQAFLSSPSPHICQLVLHKKCPQCNRDNVLNGANKCRCIYIQDLDIHLLSRFKPPSFAVMVHICTAANICKDITVWLGHCVWWFTIWESIWRIKGLSSKVWTNLKSCLNIEMPAKVRSSYSKLTGGRLSAC